MNLQDNIQAPCGTNLEGIPAYLFFTLINSLMGSQCSLGDKGFYPPDATPQLKDGDNFDFIVVGAGSAGSVVSTKLSENPDWKILVLEAGDYPSATSDIPLLFFNLQGSKEDWQYKTEKSDTSCKGFKNGQCRWPRGKVVGGSSSINAMLYVVGNDRDYDNWSKLGNDGWSYNELERFFKANENAKSSEFQNTTLYGRNGPHNITVYDNGEPITQSIADGVREMGHPSLMPEQDPRNPLGYFQSLTTIDNGMRMNAGKTFLGQTKQRNNLALAVNANVKRLLFKTGSVEVSGVEVQMGDKTMKFFAKNEVVLSAGAINTPQLLLLSGIGPKDDLKKLNIDVVKDLPGVGKNLQDHAVAALFYKIDNSAFRHKTGSFLVDDLYKYFSDRKGPFGTISITNLNGFINTRQDSTYPNIQMIHAAFSIQNPSAMPTFCDAFGFSDEITQELITTSKETSIISLMPTLLNPLSTGSLDLRSINVSDYPKITSGYFTDPDGEDMKVLKEAVQFTQKLMNTTAMMKYNPTLIQLPLPACKGDLNSDEYWNCYMEYMGTTLYHPVGTAKMGIKSDKMAVVDNRLRVYGVQKLRVIDASIMPQVISGNTNAPSLVIGHKGAEMIIEDWKKKQRPRRSEDL